MKRSEQITHITNLSLADLKREIDELERTIQAHTLAVAFGKSKQVRDIRNLKRQLARSLTIANAKVRESMVGGEVK